MSSQQIDAKNYWFSTVFLASVDLWTLSRALVNAERLAMAASAMTIVAGPISSTANAPGSQ
ncbi:hypothetical protein N2601_24345 (plasmid) [Rhizobium sp. CB3060]|uniref:hypothetical protein n=1 Tax=unclassified Rhizobium TaxID=2613769 RepID=UPI0021A626C8|nr:MULTISPECIES: hypothetical protein [Rhizobium]MDK4739907.1 hypothetical protein [Rhizobium sp. CNPSo 3464]UWU25264.1 hypothetical protein N2601_24345 [Rhizobium tropici]